MKHFNYKRIVSIILTLALTVTLLPANAFAMDPWAIDINGHRYGDAIEALRAYGIVSGHKGYFRPDDAITRGEFAAMLRKAFVRGSLSLPELDGFTDIPDGSWYTDHMRTVITLGYLEGYGNGIAAPEDALTREQAAVIFFKLMRLSSIADSHSLDRASSNFADLDDVSAWAEAAVLMMERNGYFTEYGSLFMPKESISRGRAAYLLLDLLGTIIDSHFDAEDSFYRNITIRRPGVTLKNASVAGDLLIAEGVGNGSVWLENVHIDGRLLVAGGGMNSIYLNNVTINGHVVVNKPVAAGGQPVRFHIMHANETIRLYTGTVREIVLSEDIALIDSGGDAVFSLRKPTDPDAKQRIIVSEGARIHKVTSYIPAFISGYGSVGLAEIHVNDVEIGEILTVDYIEAEPNVTVTVGDGTFTGSGVTDPTPNPSDPRPPAPSPSAWWFNQQELVLIDDTPQEVVYNGEEQGFEIDGIPNIGFVVTYLDSEGNEAVPRDAGMYTVEITRPDDGEYLAFLLTIPGGFVIVPKPVDVSGVTAEDKVYDGTADAGYAGTAGIDELAFLPEDDIAYEAIGGAAVFACKNVGVDIPVTLGGFFELTGDDAGNYILRYEEMTASITPLQLTITAPSGTPAKVYDGNTEHTGSGINIGNLSNKVESDVVDVSIYSATYNNANASVTGENQITIIYAISGADEDNYTQPANGTISASITPKGLTITGVGATAREYDGTTTVTLTGGGLQGVVVSDLDLIGFTLGSGTAASADAADGIAVTTTIGLTGNKLDKDNYTLTQPTDVRVNITRASLAAQSAGIVSPRFDNVAVQTVEIAPFAKNEKSMLVPGYLESDAANLRYAIAPEFSLDPQSALLDEWAVGNTSGTLTFNLKAELPEAENSVTIPVVVSGYQNYNDITFNVTVNVKEKEIPIVNWPTGLTATYGDVLSEISFDPFDNSGGTPGSFAWTTPEALVGNFGERWHSMTFTPTDDDTYSSLTKEVSVSVNKAIPTVTFPTAAAVTYGAELFDSALSGGSANGAFEWTNGSIIPTVVNSGYEVTFTPNDIANYDWTGIEGWDDATSTVKRTVSITVNKAVPTVEFPTAGGITYYGAALSASVLSGGSKNGDFAWTNGSIIPIVNNSGYEVTFTPEDIANYDWTGITGWHAATSTVKRTVSVSVGKADPTVTWPTAAAVTYGAALSTSALSGGVGAGTFAWKDGSIIPTVTNGGHEVTFTPADTVNFNSLTEKVAITVIKADPAVTFPTAAAITYGAALSTSTLSGGVGAGAFAWADGTTIPTVTNDGYDVTFTPDDTANFNPLTGKVDITVNAKQLSWSENNTVLNKTYDGSTTATVDSAPTLTDILEDDIVTPVAGTAAFSSADAGTWPVTASGYGIEGKDSGNYLVPTEQPEFEDAKINPATFSDDHEPHKVEVLNGDVRTVTIPVSELEPTPAVGDLGTVFGYTLPGYTPGNVSDNAEISGGNLIITSKNLDPLTVESETITVWVETQNYGNIGVSVVLQPTDKTPVIIVATAADNDYTGLPYAGLSGVLSGAFTGELEYSFFGRGDTVYSASAPPTNAGTYTVTISVPSSNMDFIGSESFPFTIIPFTLTAQNVQTLPIVTGTMGQPIPDFAADPGGTVTGVGGVLDILDGSWEWVDTEPRPDIEEINQAFPARFTPVNANYKPFEVNVPVYTSFPVSSEADLEKIGTGTDDWTLSADYILTGNITLTKNWTPIGIASPSASRFNGTFDGNGFTISGLTINTPTASNLGMFGVIGSGTVKNLGLVDVNITGYSNVGGVAGQIVNGTVTNCFVTGNVAGTTVGGIVGVVAMASVSSKIENCVALLTKVESNNAQVGRILGGSLGAYTLDGNFARDDMIIMGKGILAEGHNAIDGQSFTWNGSLPPAVPSSLVQSSIPFDLANRSEEGSGESYSPDAEPRGRDPNPPELEEDSKESFTPGGGDDGDMEDAERTPQDGIQSLNELLSMCNAAKGI
jgi:hypothetical protein